MKKRLVILFLCLFLISFVSAGFFSDVVGKITGKVVNSCGNGICELEKGENSDNCLEDCEKCVKEGKFIPSPPECCGGLKLIKPKFEDVVGILGICTAKCGNGVCDAETESEYNCPEDCRVITKYKLTCRSTYTSGWHIRKCQECEEGYTLVKCEEKGLWVFKICREVCERIYETECLENPKCEQGDAEIAREKCECRDENYKCTIENIPCCAGLKEVGLCFEEDGGCTCANCGSICLPCGNGVCNTNENRCNCPEDCGVPKQTCTQLGGTICSVDETCSGEWLDASDSERCCDGECEVTTNNLYYIDAVNGNDSNSGLSPESAWKTLGKASSTTFNGGDIILLKKGSVWYEHLDLKKPVGGDMSLTISSYGTGNKPIINCADPIPKNWNWNEYNGIYKGQILDLGPNVYINQLDHKIKQLFVLGNRKSISREPNQGYFTTQTASQNEVSSNEKLTNGFNYQGANIYLRVNNWYMDKRNVNNYNYNTGITQFSPDISSIYTLESGWGIFYSNHPSFIDQDYEWAQDSDNILFISLPSEPSNYGFTGSVRDYGIKAFWGKEGKLILNDIQIKNAADIGIHVKTDEFIAEQVPVLKSNNIGIYPLSNTIKISSCEIANSNINGITIYQSRKVTINNNRIHDNGFFATSDTIGQGLTGISVYGTDTIEITNNVIERSGYAGITVAGATTGVNNLTIKNNLITDYGLLLNDCGGIYINGDKINIVSSDISHNIIHGGFGNTDGTPWPVWNIANGIYLDKSASGFTVTDNTIYDIKTVAGGIKVNGGNRNVIKNNIVYYTHDRGSPFSMNDRGTNPMNDNIIEDNIFYTKSNDYLGVYLFKVPSDFQEGEGDPRDVFGKFRDNKNYYPLSQNMIVYYIDGVGALNSAFSINTLDFYQLGTSSTQGPFLEVNPTGSTVTKTLATSYCDEIGNVITDSIQIEPFSSRLLFDCFCNYDSLCNNKENENTCPEDCVLQ